MIKLAIRGEIIQYAAYKKEKDTQYLIVLQKKVKILEKLISSLAKLDEDIQIDHMEYIRIKKEIESLMAKKIQGAMIRCKVNWLQASRREEQQIFFAMEKHNIKRIRIGSG